MRFLLVPLALIFLKQLKLRELIFILPLIWTKRVLASFFSRETSGFVPLNQTACKTIPLLILKSSNREKKKGGREKPLGDNAS